MSNESGSGTCWHNIEGTWLLNGFNGCGMNSSRLLDPLDLFLFDLPLASPPPKTPRDLVPGRGQHLQRPRQLREGQALHLLAQQLSARPAEPQKRRAGRGTGRGGSVTAEPGGDEVEGRVGPIGQGL